MWAILPGNFIKSKPGKRIGSGFVHLRMDFQPTGKA